LSVGTFFIVIQRICSKNAHSPIFVEQM